MPDALNLRADRLQQAADALLKTGTLPQNKELRPLLETAQAVRALPRPEFRKRLKLELERKAAIAMATKPATKPTSASDTWLAPYLTVERADEVVEFIKEVFGAREETRGVGSAGGLHVTLKLGDTTIMAGGGGRGLKYAGPYYPTAIHVYVPDCDATYQRALAAGATAVQAPEDRPYGERSGTVRDVGGNDWYIATGLGGNYRRANLPESMLCLIPNGADGLLDFMTRGLGATEMGVHRIPRKGFASGAIVHAELRFGKSVVEIGEAHGPFQNRPTTIYLQVPNADTAHDNAVVAGGKSMQPPTNQPYGRVAAVQDEFGNSWYLSSPLRPPLKSQGKRK